jgi:hypothetical protein
MFGMCKYVYDGYDGFTVKDSKIEDIS